MMDFHRRGRHRYRCRNISVFVFSFCIFPACSKVSSATTTDEMKKLYDDAVSRRIFFNYEKSVRSLSPPKRMLIDGDGEGFPIIMATSLLEASNLLVLKDGSVIQSNANFGIHGQGSLNLTVEGNIIEAHTWICVTM